MDFMNVFMTYNVMTFGLPLPSGCKSAKLVEMIFVKMKKYI